MIRIAAAGNDDGLIPVLQQVCKEYGIGAECPCMQGHSADILVLGKGAEELPAVSTHTIIIADTQNTVLPQCLPECGNIIIGCSASPADTISLAARDRDRLYAGLRRSLVSLSGYVIGQQEICVDVSENVPLFHALAACAVLLLCGADRDAITIKSR